MIRIAPRAAVLVALALGGCAVDVDPASVAGYPDWYQVEATGPLPAHGDTLRRIFVNDTGRSFDGAGRYPVGTVIVKEVYALEDGAAGDRSYVAVMRRLAEAPSGGRLEGGWQFTITSDVADGERQGRRCWQSCHRAAPFGGAWFDYGR